MLQPATIRFLRALKKNNHKPWMDTHRKAYEDAKQDFESFIQTVIEAVGKHDNSLAGIQAKSCIFRINRDIRFSKDKSPYKTNMGAFINKGGKKSITAGYYFHLEPGNSFTGGGLYMPLPAELAKVRQEIDYNYDQFKKILCQPSFRKQFGGLDFAAAHRVSRLPKGYLPDNPAADHLRLKSFIAFHPFTDAELTSQSLLKQTTAALRALQPLNAFLNMALDS